MSRCYVVMGARVLPGGRPSGSLARRIRGAVELARDEPQARFLATGGLGEHPPAEALVVRDALIEQGIDVSRIAIEDRASDTLSSVLYCAPILAGLEGVDEVVVCSDRFHVRRCAILFRLVGVHATPGWIESERPALGARAWIYYWLRDQVALAWDAPQAWWHGRLSRRK